MGFTRGSVSKESACSARDLGLIPGLQRSPGEGNGNLLQYSCLGNPKDRGVWRGYSLWCRKESDMTERLSRWHAWARTKAGWEQGCPVPAGCPGLSCKQEEREGGRWGCPGRFTSSREARGGPGCPVFKTAFHLSETPAS